MMKILILLMLLTGNLSAREKVSCSDFKRGDNVYVKSDGDYKTAKILHIFCDKKIMIVDFTGNWVGQYTLSTKSLRGFQRNDCQNFYYGQGVYVKSFGYVYKTGIIVGFKCEANTADVAFTGKWGGTYTVSIQSLEDRDFRLK